MAICQGRVSALALVAVLCALTGANRCAQAVQHQVGGAPGWSLPSLAKVNYTTWASAQKFVVGDTLYFNYSKAYHNVLEVTKANFESCNATNPLSSHDDGDTIISLNKTGTFYFICGIPTHCTLGQKFAANVVKASSSSALSPSSAPSSSPAVSAGPSSSPAPGGSASKGSSAGPSGASTTPPGPSGSTPSPPSSHSSSSAVKWTVFTVIAASASFFLL